jgi:hypothetical protein
MGSSPAPKVPPRPAQVTVAITLGVTGSMVWVTGLALAWLFSQTLQRSLNYNGAAGPFYYMLERFQLRLVDGLAWPLFGFPIAAVVMAFFLLVRRRWPRIVYSVLGAASLLITTLMLHGDVTLVWPAIGYIAFTCVVLWSPSVTGWIAAGSRPQAPPMMAPGQATGIANDPGMGAPGGPNGRHPRPR